ncbi:MAG: complex I NDUFA9 subunit family protein [Pseudobdellovibrionaceae bacterium]|jgi:NADH dehydrogenase|nr:complex I NDUFA9 subunit family protein [Pseudobdellovibrionaceae bacterium]
MPVSSLIDLKDRIVTVFGGTGFVGAQIVAELLEAGARVKVVTRYPDSVYFLRQYGNVGQVVAVPCSYKTAHDLAEAVKGSDMVVNCIGVLFEKRRASFAHVHTDYPHWIAQACAKYGVQRLVHISALSVDKAQSEYAISKMSGETLAGEDFPAITILRPSVIFGADDNFINKFAKLAQILPFLPLFGGGKSKFQPVYVGDVARAVVRVLRMPHTAGKVYELGGPDVLDFKQIYAKIFKFSGLNCGTLSVPWWVARVQASLLSLLPSPPVTNDQLTSLQTDNVVHHGALTLTDIGLDATPIDEVLPHYLARYHYQK